MQTAGATDHTAGRSSARSARGFTLIELLVVLAIILVLVGLLAAGLSSAKTKAKEKSTRALIGRVQMALESYFSEFRDYPPDGYDLEVPGTTVEGVPLGSPPRRLKGTAALMYFLCRPLVKVNYMGSPNQPVDDRNYRFTPVGPFMTMTGTGNYSRGRGSDDPADLVFDPGFVWTGGPRATAFWDAPGNMRWCELTDSYYRPLCYDKVKTDGAKYFQPNRFHRLGGSGAAGTGHLVHPDQDFMQNEMPVFDEEELVCPLDDPTHNTTQPANTRYTWHVDPRFKPGVAADDGCCPNSLTTGTATSHAPRNVGGYDLWSFGSSYTNPRDDITSWGER